VFKYVKQRWIVNFDNILREKSAINWSVSGDKSYRTQYNCKCNNLEKWIGNTICCLQSYGFNSDSMKWRGHIVSNRSLRSILLILWRQRKAKKTVRWPSRFLHAISD
jgi:hypothetical protein